MSACVKQSVFFYVAMRLYGQSTSPKILCLYLAASEADPSAKCVMSPYASVTGTTSKPYLLNLELH
jgi:hypothetical protein